MNFYYSIKVFTLNFCLLIFPFISISAQSYQVLSIQGDGINIRQKPSTNSRVVLKLNTTDICDVLAVGNKEIVSGKEDYWYQVKYQSKTGWVFGAFTSLRQEGRKTIEATFEGCDVGDMEHIFFRGTDGIELDFGGAPNNLGNYNLCVEQQDDWIPIGNPLFVGKKFQVTYSMIKCLIYGFEGNSDGEVVEWPCIVELKLVTPKDF